MFHCCFNLNIFPPQNCLVMNDNVMKCPSPPLADSLKNIIRSKRLAVASPVTPPVKKVQLGFIMDGVATLRNLSQLPDVNTVLEYFPNPRIYNFTQPQGILNIKGENLIIEVS